MRCISFDTFNPFSHSANPNIIHTVGITLAQVDFCTLANNAYCSSKREHIPHTNDTNRFEIKHSFIIIIIITHYIYNALNTMFLSAGERRKDKEGEVRNTKGTC